MTVPKYPVCRECAYFDRGLHVCEACEDESHYEPSDEPAEDDDDFDDDDDGLIEELAELAEAA